MTWGSISLFGGSVSKTFLEKENPLETLIVISENVSPKGFSWLKMKYFEISVLTANSRYLQTAALKEIFHDSLKISKFTGICMENHSSMTGWQLKVVFHIQILLIFGGCFWGIRLKIHRLPNFLHVLSARTNKIFQKLTVFVFTKS